jgi:hypothetical protein
MNMRKLSAKWIQKWLNVDPKHTSEKIFEFIWE